MWKETGYTYIIQCDVCGIKIGCCGNVSNRLIKLQREHGTPLYVLAVLRTRRLERVLHERFRQYRIKGEWFCNGYGLNKYINSFGVERIPLLTFLEKFKNFRGFQGYV